MWETRKPVSTQILPSITSLAKAVPKAPRAASLSLAPPPNAFSGLSPRSSQMTSVAGASSLRRTRSISVPIAEWPAPSTATVRPA